MPFEARYHARRRLLFAMIAAAGFHAALATGLSAIASRDRNVSVTASVTSVDVVRVPPRVAPLIVQDGREPAHAIREPRPKSSARVAQRATASPASALASAAVPANNATAPIDLTGAWIVAVSSPHMGGVADAANPDSSAVSKLSRAAPNGSARTIAAGSDHSRAASLLGGSDWQCPFPPEADAAQIDFAIVTLEVALDAEGRPRAVSVLQDPGHGFAREARRCALDRNWTRALDSQGRAIDSSTVIKVRFER